jgi:hypothetical protein
MAPSGPTFCGDFLGNFAPSTTLIALIDMEVTSIAVSSFIDSSDRISA